MFVLHDGIEISFRLHTFLNRMRKAFEAAKAGQLFFAEVRARSECPVTAPRFDIFRAIKSISQES